MNIDNVNYTIVKVGLLPSKKFALFASVKAF